MIGLDNHRELRAAFDESSFRRAWLIDGKLAGIGGVCGPAASAYGMIWVAFSKEATRYPLQIIKLMRAHLAELMETHNVLFCTIVDGDEASARFAIFLGFVPGTEGRYSLPAISRHGRKELAREFAELEHIQVPNGTARFRMMSYRPMEGV